MSCIITRKSRASIPGKLHQCQTSVIAENIPHADHETHLRTVKDATILIPQFPRSSLGTRGLQTRSHRQEKETTAFLESRSTKASSTNNGIT